MDSVINRYIFASIKVRTEDPDARWIDEKKNSKNRNRTIFWTDGNENNKIRKTRNEKKNCWTDI